MYITILEYNKQHYYILISIINIDILRFGYIKFMLIFYRKFPFLLDYNHFYRLLLVETSNIVPHINFIISNTYKYTIKQQLFGR